VPFFSSTCRVCTCVPVSPSDIDARKIDLIPCSLTWIPCVLQICVRVRDNADLATMSVDGFITRLKEEIIAFRWFWCCIISYYLSVVDSLWFWRVFSDQLWVPRVTILVCMLGKVLKGCIFVIIITDVKLNTANSKKLSTSSDFRYCWTVSSPSLTTHINVDQNHFVLWFVVIGVENPWNRVKLQLQFGSWLIKQAQPFWQNQPKFASFWAILRVINSLFLY
jgi:hypothetical protein